MLRFWVLAPVGALAFLLIPMDAHAYLDPGTGSYVLQMIIAGLLGAAFAIKMSWFRIKRFITGLFSRNDRNQRPASPGRSVRRSGTRRVSSSRAAVGSIDRSIADSQPTFDAFLAGGLYDRLVRDEARDPARRDARSPRWPLPLPRSPTVSSNRNASDSSRIPTNGASRN